MVAAENAKPHKKTVQIKLDGRWDADETTMLRDSVWTFPGVQDITEALKKAEHTSV